MTTAEPGTRRLPLNFFGIAFGTAGLAGTWTTAGQLLDAPVAVGEALWAVAGLAWGFITIEYLRRPGGLRAVARDLHHPVLGPFAALVPAVGSLLSAHLFQWYPVASTIAVWTMLVLSATHGAWFVSSVLSQPRDTTAIHGGYLLPTVAATLVASQSLATIGQRDVAIGLLAVGIMFWMLLASLLVVRYSTGPAVPPALFPTVAIFAAPPAVAGNAWWAISEGRYSIVDTVFAALMIALLVPHLFLLPVYTRTPFVIGFWATTFTVAASATYAIRLLTTATGGPLGSALSWLALLVATLVIGGIAVRSLGLIPRLGRRAAARA
ncbi:hypothetical protein ACFQHV_22175 [Promicromonospora thailandica]|uniref:Tellurite resistance protein n=1 Tax=Promicromonospora thailandica TaxID=765201 RepID=A0A9X2FXR6_9MICO|nr:hypothetical protein [Promicromonospora thailandica]MCP2263084.1 tellurite resistance protein [Promicromonospora thailandica]